MSRRHILEDSDSDDDGQCGVGFVAPSNIDFFTDDEKNAIGRCRIQLNDKGGIYSEKYMSDAIARLGKPPLELVQDSDLRPLNQKYRVKNESKSSNSKFFERDYYEVHDQRRVPGNCDPTCFEEAILLEIEAIRQSEKAVKNVMFKKKETGGKVVFGPWFNYALQRLLELSSSHTSGTAMATPPGEYTAVKIIGSLFSFIANDLNEVIKCGQLEKLKTIMGVDLVGNVNTARKVIDHIGGSAHFLHNELVRVEAHVKSLIERPPDVLRAATSTIRGAAVLSAPVAVAKSALPATSKAVAAAPITHAPSVTATQTRLALMKAKTAPPDKKMSASSSANDNLERNRAAEFAVQSQNPARVTSSRGQTNNGSSIAQPHYPSHATLKGGQSNDGCLLTSNGWGRVRDGSQAPYKTKGTWSMARRILGCTIQLEHNSQETMGRNERPALQHDSFARVPWDAPSAACAASVNNVSARDDIFYSRARSHEDTTRGGSSNNPPYRTDDYSSRSTSSRSPGRFDDRMSDHRNNRRSGYSRDSTSSGHADDRSSVNRCVGRDTSSHRSNSRSGDRDDYPSLNSRGGNNSRENFPRDAYCSSRSREERSQDHHGKGMKHSRSNDYGDMDARSEKSYRGSNLASAPRAMESHAPIPHSAGAGRGRDKNKPAWMTQQEQLLAHNGPIGMPDSIGVPANSFTASSIQQDLHSLSTPSLNAPSNGVGLGRDATLSAWMAEGPTSSGKGRGRGENVNLPAWMTTKSSHP